MRQKFRWNVQLQGEDGEIVEVGFEAFWSPERDFITTESVAAAAAAREYVRRGKTTRFAGISAVPAA
jgi:hypothetical protein